MQKLSMFGTRESPDEWLRTLASVPMLRQPGEAWLYNICSDIQGVLAARVSGRPLPEFLAERILEPLGMIDNAFHVPAGKLDQLPPYHAPDSAVIDDDHSGSRRSFPPARPGTFRRSSDWHRFDRMLLADGGGLLTRQSVQQVMTDHLTQEQRDASTSLLEGAGWGFGGAVSADGRYGWSGGAGTAGHIVPATGTTGILLTQVQMPGPVLLIHDFWRYAFGEFRGVAAEGKRDEGREPTRGGSSRRRNRCWASAAGRAALVSPRPMNLRAVHLVAE